MQAASRLSLQAIVRGSSSRCLLGRSTIVDGVAAPLAPRSSLRPPLPSIRHKSASSFAANVDEPSATGDAGGVEVPVLNTKGKGSLSQEKHSASSSKLPPKEERHRSTWTDEENFEEVLKRTPNLPNASYDETVFNKGIADTAAKYRKIVDRRLALYERSDPAVLEMCMVDSFSRKSPRMPLLECCTVQADEQGFLLQVQDKRRIPHVESALKRDRRGLGLLSQPFHAQQDGLIRIQIPAPTLESRLKLLRELHMVIEKGRDKMRKDRSTAQKQLKRDWFEKRISRDEWLSLQKRMFTEARRGTDELLDVDRPMKRECDRIKDEILGMYSYRWTAKDK